MTAVGATLAGRALAESLMLDTCKITRPGTATGIDPDTGLPREPEPVTIYDGPCKVQDTRTVVQVAQSGDHAYTLNQLYVHVPVSAIGIKVGDTITITASPLDPAQVGRAFRVAGLFRKTMATAQRLPVEEVQG